MTAEFAVRRDVLQEDCLSIEKALKYSEAQALKLKESLKRLPSWVDVDNPTSVHEFLMRAVKAIHSSQSSISMAWQMIHKTTNVPEIYLGRPIHMPDPPKT